MVNYESVLNNNTFLFLWNRFQTCTEVFVMPSHRVKWSLCCVSSCLHTLVPLLVRRQVSLPACRWPEYYYEPIQGLPVGPRGSSDTVGFQCHCDNRHFQPGVQTGRLVESGTVIILSSSVVNFCPSSNLNPQCHCSTGRQTGIAELWTCSMDRDRDRKGLKVVHP